MQILQVIGYYHDGLEIFTQIIAIVVAVIAARTYWVQKRQERKTAALLIINQIDDAEKIVDLLRKPENMENRVLYKLPDIISENYWEKYKVLVMSYLDNSDIEIINRYYSSIALIQKGKNRICNDLEDNWQCRSTEYNDILSEIAELKVKNSEKDDTKKENEKELKEKNEILNAFFMEDRIFRAGVGIDMLKEGISCFESIKGTSAYKTLERKSYRKIKR